MAVVRVGGRQSFRHFGSPPGRMPQPVTVTIPVEPFLIVVAKPGKRPTADMLLQHLRSRIAKWWLPDAVVLVDEIPHTATGKILKTELRRQFADFRLDT